MADHRDPPSSADIAAAGSANDGQSKQMHPTLSRLQADITRPTSAPPGPLATTEEVDPQDIRMKPEYYNWYRAQHPRDPRVPAPAIRWGGPQKSKQADGTDANKPLGGVGLVQMIQEDFPRTPSPVYDTKLVAAHTVEGQLPPDGLQVGLGVNSVVQFLPSGIMGGNAGGVTMGNLPIGSGMQVGGGVNAAQLQSQQQFHLGGMGGVGGHPQQQLGMNGTQQQMFMSQPNQQLVNQNQMQMGGMGSVGSVGEVGGLSMTGMQGMQQGVQGMQMNTGMGNVQNSMQQVQGMQGGMQQMGGIPMQGMQNMQMQGMQPMQNMQGMQAMQSMGQQNQMGGQMGMGLMNQNNQHSMQPMQNMQGQFYNNMVPQMGMGYSGGNNYMQAKQDGTRNKLVYMQTPNGVMQMILDEQTGYAFPVYDQQFQQQQQGHSSVGVGLNGMGMNMGGMTMNGMQGGSVAGSVGSASIAGLDTRQRQPGQSQGRGQGQGGNRRGDARGPPTTPSIVPPGTPGGSESTEAQSELMQRFLATKNDPTWDLLTLRGHIVEFSKHQEGSRLIQRKLESDTCSQEEKDLVFAEVQPEALNLMTDVFGNYVIQKLFEHGLDHHKHMLAQCLKGHVLNLTMQTYGCRVIQKALDVLPQEEKRGVAQELDQHILRCVLDQNGNHVIQKCIESIGPEDVKFIVNAFLGNVQNLAVHAYGCRVIQRILEYCENHHEVIEPILDEILDNVDVLVQDQYGNYVVQHVLTNGKPTYQYAIVERMRHNVLTLSRHKFASNAIEKMFQYCSKESRSSMVTDLLKPLPPDNQSALCQMVKDPFANYVVQRIIETADEGQRRQIIEHIKPQIATLRRYTYGKHIIAKIEKLNASGK